MIKNAVFDLDHTLFDRYATLRKIAEIADARILPFKDVSDRKAIGELMVKTDKENILFGWQAIFNVYSTLGILKPEVTAQNIYEEYFAKMYSLAAVPYDFTKPMLTSLRKKGIKTGLITNGHHDLQYAKLNMLGLPEMFDFIVVSGDTPYQKPDTRVFDYFCEKFGVLPDDSLYIGDSPLNDVYASGRAGFTPVWVKTSGHWPFDYIKKPKYTVDTVEEIPDIIEKINKKD